MPFLRWLCLACVMAAQVAWAEDPFGPDKGENAPPKEKAAPILPEKAEADAAEALQRSDTRFLDVTGYDAVVGVDRWDDALKEKYGTRLLGHVGGMMFDGDQEAREKAIISYATRYNQHLVKELKIQFPPEQKREGVPQSVQIEELIDQLALSNEPAVDLLFPTPSVSTPKMDRRMKIHDAYRKLGNHGFAAYPQLLAHLDDDRQSIQFASIRRATVGKACYSILNDQLHRYPDDYPRLSWGRTGADGESHVRPGYFNPVYQEEGIKVWLEKRKGKSLVELQLEVMEWTLEGEKKIGVAEATDSEEIIEPLEKQVAMLRKRVAEKKAEEK